MTLAACDCVQFFMLRDDKTRICGMSDMKCFQRIDDEFQEVKANCKCFDSCQSLKYSVQKSVIDSDVDTISVYRSFMRLSNFEIKFKAKDFHPLVRKKNFSILDFISFAGGLLGLLAGFSALSAFEIFYFFFIKMWTEGSNRVFTRNARFQENNFGYLDKFLKSTSVHTLNYISIERRKVQK